MKTARSTSAPKMPQNSTRNWYSPGHGEEAEDHRPDEDVVDREALLDQVAGEVLARRLRRPCQPQDHEREGQADARSRPRSRSPLP